MFKDKFQNFKSIIIKKSEGNNKKNIENLVTFLVLLIITVIAVNTIWGTDKEETKSKDTNTTYKQLADNLDSSNNENLEEYNLEEELEDILSKIAGVGKVQVLITYSETSEVVAMYNETYTSSNTEETDTNGGVRKIESTDTNKEIIYEEKDGEKIPITQKVIMPKMEGAIITAEGAGNVNIKTNIIQAVSAATGLSAYRIQVFEMSV
ncbi:MAG: hypothetical protein IJB90_05950 [Clostridia bacterium]|nr:hypothetical protein [Clostridia bacterium]